MEETNTFQNLVKNLQFPNCEKEDHEDIPLNKICIDPNCSNQFKIACASCIEDKQDLKHMHQDKFILLKSFLKQLNHFRLIQEEEQQENQQNLLNIDQQQKNSPNQNNQQQQQQQQSTDNKFRNKIGQNNNRLLYLSEKYPAPSLQQFFYSSIHDKINSPMQLISRDIIKQEDQEIQQNQLTQKNSQNDQDSQESILIQNIYQNEENQKQDKEKEKQLEQQKKQEILQQQKQKQQQQLQELLQNLQQTSKECLIIQDTFAQYAQFLKDLMQKLINPDHETPQDQLKHLINQIMETKSYFQQRNNLEQNLLKLRKCIEIINPSKDLGFKLYREYEETRIQTYLEQVNTEISQIKQNIILTKNFSIPKQIRSVEFQISTFENSNAIKYDRQSNSYSMDERGRGYIYSKLPIKKGKMACSIRIDELKNNGNFYAGLIKTSEVNDNPFSPIINQSLHQFSNECGMQLIQNEQNLTKIDSTNKFPIKIDLMLDIDNKEFTMKIPQNGITFKSDQQGERYINQGIQADDSFRFTLIWSSIQGQIIYIN